MPIIDLSHYHFPKSVTVSGAVREWPATWIDPGRAPIVFLVDEEHLTQAAIDENAANVSAIIKAVPGAVVVLEHFISGQRVDANTPATYGGSDFHLKLLNLVQANTIGGDDLPALKTVLAVNDDYNKRIANIVQDIRNPPPLDFRIAEKARLLEEGRKAMRAHPGNLIRSQRLIETLVNEMTARGQRVGVMNAGSHHNSHVWDNASIKGQPVCAVRSQVTFIRFRPGAHPTPLAVDDAMPPHGPLASLEERRRVTAYFQWIERGRQAGGESVDWAWAEQHVTS